MNLRALFQRPSPQRALMLSCALIAGSAYLLWFHAASVQSMREIGLPAAIRLSQLEKRMDILTQQHELAELQASLRGGSMEEAMQTYALPDTEDIDRVLAMFDVMFTYLQGRQQLRTFSAVSVGDRAGDAEDLDGIPVVFTVTATPEGLATLLSFIDVSGLLTIGDALSRQDIDRLLALTEQENPASVSTLEYFLATDLLSYVREPRPYNDQLQKAFSESAQPLLLSVIESPELRSARSALQDLAPVLRAQKLWPLRLLTVQKASSEVLSNGMVKAELEIRAYVRK